MHSAREITKPSALLDNRGALIQYGWARKPLLQYNRENIAVKWHRIKEWDNYEIHNPELGLGFGITISDVGYFGLIGIELIDFKKKNTTSWGTVRLLTRGRWGLPTSSTRGDIQFRGRSFNILIQRLVDRRIIKINYPRFRKRGLKGTVTLFQDPSKESFVMIFPNMQDHRKFYYSDKIVNMPAQGSLQVGEEKIRFSQENSYGRLDWGRGVWPYKTQWFWGVGVGKINGNNEIAFSIGYNYNDPSITAKNQLLYNGRVHKLDQVFFNAPKRPGSLWKFSSNDHRFEATLNVVYNKKTNLNLGIIGSHARVAYGYYSGWTVLDDGTRIDFHDLWGHAEEIHWRW